MTFAITQEARTKLLQDRLVAVLSEVIGLTSIRDLCFLVEGAIVRYALTKTHGSQSAAARLLGWDRITFARRMRRHGFDHVAFGGIRGRNQRGDPKRRRPQKEEGNSVVG